MASRRHTHNSTTKVGFYKSAIQSVNGREAIVKIFVYLSRVFKHIVAQRLLLLYQPAHVVRFGITLLAPL